MEVTYGKQGKLRHIVVFDMRTEGKARRREELTKSKGLGESRELTRDRWARPRVCAYLA